MLDYTIYVVDTETTSLDYINGDVIEVSLYNLKTDNQKTWLIRPINEKAIEFSALRVNGHKLEDITHQTKFGKENYLDPDKAIISIENWLAEDLLPSERRILCGHNVNFDRNMLEQLWNKCSAKDSYPFGRRCVDTMMIEIFLDYCKGSFSEGYSLSNLTKKYSVKNEKSHSAAADTKATKEVFMKQVEFFKKFIQGHNA